MSCNALHFEIYEDLMLTIKFWQIYRSVEDQSLCGCCQEEEEEREHPDPDADADADPDDKADADADADADS